MDMISDEAYRKVQGRGRDDKGVDKADKMNIILTLVLTINNNSR